MKKLFAASIILLTVAAGLPSASADDRTIEDSMDDGAPDLVSASHGHLTDRAASEDVLVHTFTFAEAPNEGELLYVDLFVWLPDGDRRFDRRVNVAYNPDGSLRGSVESDRRLRGFANAFWADDRTLRVEFTKSSLSRKLEEYEWRALAVLACPPPEVGPCPSTPPQDWVPEPNRKIRHRL